MDSAAQPMRGTAAEQVLLGLALSIDGMTSDALQGHDRRAALKALEAVQVAVRFKAADDARSFWTNALFCMVRAHLLDDGRFRRDDFDTARRMLRAQIEKTPCVPHRPS